MWPKRHENGSVGAFASSEDPTCRCRRPLDGHEIARHEADATKFNKLGRVPSSRPRMNADLHIWPTTSRRRTPPTLRDPPRTRHRTGPRRRLRTRLAAGEDQRRRNLGPSAKPEATAPKAPLVRSSRPTTTKRAFRTPSLLPSTNDPTSPCRPPSRPRSTPTPGRHSQRHIPPVPQAPTGRTAERSSTTRGGVWGVSECER